MKKVLGLAALMLALGTTMAFDVEAKRLGGAKSSGMQRQQTLGQCQARQRRIKNRIMTALRCHHDLVALVAHGQYRAFRPQGHSCIHHIGRAGRVHG